MHPDGDRSLDELLAGTAPVTDHDLDRPVVRAAARALIEELPMTAHPTAPPAATDDPPPLGIGPARGADAGTPDDLVVRLSARGERPRRRSRLGVAAAVAALALALGSAAVVGGGDDGGEPVDSLDPAAGPVAAGSPVAPGQPADQPNTACEWADHWLDADARADQEGRYLTLAGLAEVGARSTRTGDLQEAREAELYSAAMSAGDRGWVETRHAETCGA